MPVNRNTKLGVRIAGAGILALGGSLAYYYTKKEQERLSLEVADHVDLSRYTGDWYEIAKLPAPFEKDCYNSKAHYTLNTDGTLNITNTCNKNGARGKTKTSKAKAYVTDTTTNARLKLRFYGGVITGDYEIIALDEDYKYAMVGTANRKFLWVLSRTPFLEKIHVIELLEKAKTQGFPVENLRYTYQG